MRKLIVTTFVTPGEIMEASRGPEEYLTGAHAFVRMKKGIREAYEGQ